MSQVLSKPRRCAVIIVSAHQSGLPCYSSRPNVISIWPSTQLLPPSSKHPACSEVIIVRDQVVFHDLHSWGV